MNEKTYKLFTTEDKTDSSPDKAETESLVKQLQNVQVEEQDESSAETAS